jgi:hypothetical protein
MGIPEDSTIIDRYTAENAVADGVNIRIAERLYCTTDLARRLAPSADTETGFDPERLMCLMACFVNKRREKIYFDPGATAYPEETCREFVTYLVGSHKVWGIEDGDGLTFLLPEDY